MFITVEVESSECFVSIDATTDSTSPAFNDMDDRTLGQTFTAVDDTVCGFQFNIGTGAGFKGDISVDSDAVLYDVSDTNAPVELARKTFPAPISGVTDFFFDNPVPVEVGGKYFIGIDSNDNDWGLYQICNCQCSCYDGGGRAGFDFDGTFYGGADDTDDYYFKVYAYEPPCSGDFDHDGDVDGSDLAVFAADYGRTDCPCTKETSVTNEIHLNIEIERLKAELATKDEEIAILKSQME